MATVRTGEVRNRPTSDRIRPFNGRVCFGKGDRFVAAGTVDHKVPSSGLIDFRHGARFSAVPQLNTSLTWEIVPQLPNVPDEIGKLVSARHPFCDFPATRLRYCILDRPTKIDPTPRHRADGNRGSLLTPAEARQRLDGLTIRRRVSDASMEFRSLLSFGCTVQPQSLRYKLCRSDHRLRGRNGTP